MATVTISNVGKRYGAVEVLRDANVNIADGEFVVLVGPSGCGKSTLLRMLAGLESVTSGEVAINGQTVNHLQPKDRDIAMVFQNYALYPHMTVAQNMAFSLELKGVSKPDREERIKVAAESLGIAGLLHRYPRQLSGGQRQRVAMGRAIVRNPKVFLFDEPLSNLDAKMRVQVRTEIKELHQRLNTTTIYVTHDQVEAMTMADRIVVMREGKIEQIGSPLELYDHPANLFVASFIGSPAMNLFPGRVDGDRFLIDSAPSLAIEVPQGTVTLGVRPEHVIIGSEGIPATVKTVEPLGSEMQILLMMGSQPVTALVRERMRVAPGDVVSIRPAAGYVHFFDRDGCASDVGRRCDP